MYKRYKVFDCFLEVAYYCLHTDADFVTYEKIGKQKFDAVDSRIFCILKVESNGLRAIYVTCCSNFVDFQIDLFKVMPDTFPLACNYAERCCYGDVDFDYGVDHLEAYYDAHDEDYLDDSDTDDDQWFEKTRALNSSVSSTHMRLEPLRFTRFSLECQQIFFFVLCQLVAYFN